ncbi:MAG: homoserine kinase [Thermoanaerobacteraceae bacterium]|jgi:homoserine kinase|nr:homoserine kinase [Thermoanaerobacteraceae bacterium]
MDKSMMHVRVPASTANLGPGFDCLGIALNLYNDIYMELSGKELTIEVAGEGQLFIERNEENLVYKAAKKIFDRLNIKLSGLKIKTVNEIPLGSGLGSSAAAIIGGMVLANRICGNPLSSDDILDLASEMEGHADNVGPSLNGGFNVATYDGVKTLYIKKRIDDDINFIAFYPNREVKTTRARGVLPERIDYKNAVFNVGRASLLTAAFMTGDYAKLRYATEDMLHQVYRKELIPELYFVIEAALMGGAYGAFLSGAGPTMMAVSSNDMLDNVIKSVEAVYRDRNIPLKIYRLKCDNIGAK